MKLLVVASTVCEIEPLLGLFGIDNFTTQLSGGVKYLSHDIDLLIPGVGLMKTSFFLGRQFAVKKYDFALNVGLAGSFSKELEIGSVVNIASEQVADLGAEDGSGFLDIFDLGLEQKDAFPFKDGKIENETDREGYGSITSLPAVKGISLNTCHGRMESIENTISRLNPDVESMEGAAFMFACRMEETPFFELRAISNYVEPRNREMWDISKAVHQLNSRLIKVLKEMACEVV